MDMVTRFLSYVDRGGPIVRPELGPCHVWTGGKFAANYGAFSLGGKTVQAHRVAFFIAHGRWPEPCALHKCDNRPCVRPEHLFEGTKGDNNRDRHAKGRTCMTGNLAGLARATERARLPWARDKRCGPKNGAHTHPEKRPHGETHGRAKVTDDEVVAIRAMRATGVVYRVIADVFGIKIPQVHRICAGKQRVP